MRVLWFTNTPCNYNRNSGIRGYNGGGWLTSLEDELTKEENIQLGICFCQDGQPFKVEQDGVVYYPVSRHTKAVKDKILDILHFSDPKRDAYLWNHYKESFKKAIDDFKPDVVHIFGSELYMGLATFVAPCPVVLHIQGLLSLSIYMFFPAGVSKKSFIFQDWNLKRVLDRFQLCTYWQRSCYREQEVLKHTKHIIGRTHWDKMATSILNPERIYHYGGEILRPVFYEHGERQMPKKLTIVTTSSGAMYKGFDFVLKVADILRNKMNIDFEWKVYGNIRPKFFEKVTKIKHNDVNVKLCGVASAEQLKDAILHSTLYFQPSYIENSPNSVCEAQILGTPPIATNVGGTSSLIEDGETGYLVPAGEPYYAAYQIVKLYQDMELNAKIGNKAKVVALKRHDREYIVNDLINTYKNVMSHE